MDTQQPSRPFYAKPLYRLLAGVFGAFLLAVGLFALFFVGGLTALGFIVGLTLIVLGFNLLLSAYRARESWISRIGPLP